MPKQDFKYVAFFLQIKKNKILFITDITKSIMSYQMIRSNLMQY